MEKLKGSIVLLAVSLIALIAGGIFVSSYWRTALYYPSDLEETVRLEAPNEENLIVPEKEEGVLKKIKNPSKNGERVKGLYMNEFVANSQSFQAVSARNEIRELLENTEVNAVVIDIKEVHGPNLQYSLKTFIEELQKEGVWVIARICVFRDGSLIEDKPEWYLKDKNTGEIWQDSGGGYWLDPKVPGVQSYIINFSKLAIDFGFDELQFDYIRFPSDGDVQNVVYPAFGKDKKQKYEVISEFFSTLSRALRGYKSDIVLSVDLFGYIAAQHQAFEIGQRTYDAAHAFDYLSFMLYPSHFYSGFSVGADEKRGLPAIDLPYEADDISETVSANPYQVVSRSIFIAQDYLSQIGSEAKIRPWLQDFDITYDYNRKIYYDAKKVRDQILAAEEAGADGWLLWNPKGEYTKEALRKE